MEPLTLAADSLLGMPLSPPVLLLFCVPLCLTALEADDDDEEALPGDAARGSCDTFPPF